MSRPWIKLQTSIIDHFELDCVSPMAFKVFIKCLAMAGEVDGAGRIGAPAKVAHRLRLSEADLMAAVNELGGRVEMCEGELCVRDWTQHQPATTSTERAQRSRSNEAQRPGNVAAALQQRAGNETAAQGQRASNAPIKKENRLRKEPPLPPTPPDDPPVEPAPSERSRAPGGAAPSKANSNGNGLPERRWTPLCAAVSESLGGIRVVDSRKGEPLSWMGEICAIAGRHAGDDVQAACLLWAAYRASPKWQYKPAKPIDLPPHFGTWCADNPGALARAASLAEGGQVLLTEAEIEHRWPRLVFRHEGGPLTMKAIHVLRYDGLATEETEQFDRTTWTDEQRACQEAIEAFRAANPLRARAS